MNHENNQNPLQLSGFNNLTKCLSFNIYDFCVAKTEKERQSYVKFVNENYNAEKISNTLRGICDIIEANILNESAQDYDPWGSSAMILMSDIKGGGVDGNTKCSDTPTSSGVKMHLDKSHICSHTYPDFHQDGQISSIRVDIDIATCGEISPLKALNYLFSCFASDVVIVDYVVRGFTRDHKGQRIYIDHPMRSIQDYIKDSIVEDYHCVDLALQTENIWQTKMLRTSLDKKSYFMDPSIYSDEQIDQFISLVNKDMRGILHMWPS